MIVEREQASGCCLKDQMIVLFNLGRIDAPPARHAEMKNERIASICLDHAIFCSPPKARDARASQPLAHVRWNWPPEICSAGLDANEKLTLQHRGESANSCFNFGQFRHGFALAGALPLG